jgi:hypothetical protein
VQVFKVGNVMRVTGEVRQEIERFLSDAKKGATAFTVAPCIEHHTD